MISTTKEYRAWAGMFARCYNRNSGAYKNYGGRGIKVCKRWWEFENFIADVGLAPSPKHTLDRYPNNDGNYEPGNTRWTTWGNQSRNRRSTKMITYNGETMCIADWSAKLGIPRKRIYNRVIYGWKPEKIFTTVPIIGAKKGENNVLSRLTDRQRLELYGLYVNGATKAELARKYNVSWNCAACAIKKNTPIVEEVSDTPIKEFNQISQ